MVYVDPLKLQASQLGVMDVVHAVNDSNLILPAGDVRIGPKDYNIYANSQLPTPDEVNSIPLKTVGNASILVGDVGHAVDGGQLQTNIVRVDGQHSVYIPVLKQGGDSNTITIVNGIRKATAHLLDIPQQLKTAVVFDQSVFVKTAIKNVISEGSIGLCLTGIMILLFLGNVRATVAVLLSIPISCIATFLILKAFGDSINTMVLGGMALVLSRLIDNSVVVLENIFRHFEMGSDPVKASQEGGKEVQLAVLAATFSTAIVFFPVVLLTGVSKYLFTALALAVVIALFCSYVVAMTVVPLFCSRFIKHTKHDHRHESAESDDPVPEHMRGGHGQTNIFARIVYQFNHGFGWLQARYDKAIHYCRHSLAAPISLVPILANSSSASRLQPAPALNSLTSTSLVSSRTCVTS
jgi:multidrug efflux pump subunit AcrB